MTANSWCPRSGIAARLGHKPQPMLADGGYTNRRSVEAMAQLSVDYVGSLRRRGGKGGSGY